MANIQILDEKTIRIEADLTDAVSMVQEAAADITEFADEIITIYEKMPVFEYVHFCFYAYDSARLFENMLGMDPRQYTSFSMDAPESFFYALYGGMAGLYPAAKRAKEGRKETA